MKTVKQFIFLTLVLTWFNAIASGDSTTIPSTPDPTGPYPQKFQIQINKTDVTLFSAAPINYNSSGGCGGTSIPQGYDRLTTPYLWYFPPDSQYVIPRDGNYTIVVSAFVCNGKVGWPIPTPTLLLYKLVPSEPFNPQTGMLRSAGVTAPGTFYTESYRTMDLTFQGNLKRSDVIGFALNSSYDNVTFVHAWFRIREN